MAPPQYHYGNRVPRVAVVALYVFCAAAPVLGRDASSPKRADATKGADTSTAEDSAAPAASPGEAPSAESTADRRKELNLLGVTDVASGESRRNENVQFNPVDNNAAKELNIRMGTTATIVEQFKVDRNYFGSEFGGRPTSPLHVGESQSSGFHGTLYESHNNSLFSARSFFQAGGVRPARENDYGFTLGAPLWRGGQVFLEGSQQKIRGSVNGNVLVPKADERTPLTTDPEKRAIVEQLLAAFPNELPNRTDIDERALNTNSPQVVDTDNLGVRLDQSGDRDRLTLRYHLTSQSVDAFQLVAGQNPDTNTKAHTARITWNRAWSAVTVTDFSAGYDRVGTLLVPEENNPGPSVRFAGVIDGVGGSPSIPLNRAQNLFRYAGRLRQEWGPHSLTAGFELLRRQVNGSESSTHRGFVSFRSDSRGDALTNFRMGLPGRFSGAVGNAQRGFRSWVMQYYVGDVWRVGSNLNLSLGFRYQPLPRPSEVNGLNSFPYPCDCNNVAGQFGFAYRLPASWGVIRGAYGLHYADIIPTTYQQVRFNPPGTIKFADNDPDLVEVLRGLNVEPDPNARSTIFELPPDLAAPFSQQYNFSWEPLSSAAWKIQLGYVGSRSQKLFMRVYTNRADRVDGIKQISSTVDERRPNQNHFDIRKISNISRGYFDALRISLVIPSRRGLAVDASYWFSKAIDLGADFTSTGASGVSRSFRNQSGSSIFDDLKGPSAFDQSHALLWRAAYATPALAGRRGFVGQMFGEWDISAIVLVKTGTPFTVISGSDSPGFGNVDGSRGDRPHVVDPAVLGRAIAHPDDTSLLPASAFAFISPAEDRGNLGRNTFRKDGIRNINAAISRTWRLPSEKTLTFRAESINFFNTPQFAEPTLELTSPSFGQITNTLNDGRAFRFLLRFGF